MSTELDTAVVLGLVGVAAQFVTTQAAILAVTSAEPERVAAGREALVGGLSESLSMLHARLEKLEAEVTAERVAAQAYEQRRPGSGVVEECEQDIAPLCSMIAALREAQQIALALAGPDLSNASSGEAQP